MLIINGGGWFMNGAGMVSGDRADAGYGAIWVADRQPHVSSRATRALPTWSGSTTRHGRVGFEPAVRRAGGSAGGISRCCSRAARSTVSCVISEAGPTDAQTIVNESTRWGRPTARGGSTTADRRDRTRAASVVESGGVPDPRAGTLGHLGRRSVYPMGAGNRVAVEDAGRKPERLRQSSGPPVRNDPWCTPTSPPPPSPPFQAAEQALVAPLVS